MSRAHDITYVILRDEKVKENETKCFYEMKNTPSQLNKKLIFVSIIYFSTYLYLIAMLKVKQFLLLVILVLL